LSGPRIHKNLVVRCRRILPVGRRADLLVIRSTPVCYYLKYRCICYLCENSEGLIRPKIAKCDTRLSEKQIDRGYHVDLSSPE
jgi:hypothetical protein